MTGPVWTPSPERIAQANMSAFLRFAGVGETYDELYRWSVLHPERFWPTMWEFADVIAEERGGGRDQWDEVIVVSIEWRRRILSSVPGGSPVRASILRRIFCAIATIGKRWWRGTRLDAGEP